MILLHKIPQFRYDMRSKIGRESDKSFFEFDGCFCVQIMQWLHECVCDAQGKLVLNFCSIWGTLG